MENYLKILHETRPLAEELFHEDTKTDGSTDRHNDVYSLFLRLKYLIYKCNKCELRSDIWNAKHFPQIYTI
jgi:hypothetical protein